MRYLSFPTAALAYCLLMVNGDNAGAARSDRDIDVNRDRVQWVARNQSFDRSDRSGDVCADREDRRDRNREDRSDRDRSDRGWW